MEDNKKIIASCILETLDENVDINDIYNKIEVPKDKKNGDFSYPCFNLAKILKNSPVNIANKIKEKIVLNDAISKVEVVNGFLNFYLNSNNVVENILKNILTKNSEYGKMNIGNGKNIVFDYSSPNIAKPFHLGHFRNTVIGHALYNIYKELGYNTIGINYIGDWGRQFGLLIEGYKLFKDEYDFSNNVLEVLSDIYVRISALAKEDENVMNKARENFKELENGNEEYYKLWKFFREVSLKEYDRIYDILGVKFDSYNGEAFYNDKMDVVIDTLTKKNVLKESRGAKVVEVGDNMPPCIVLKSNGSTIYATRDLAAIIYRAKTYDFEKAIYVTGSEQILHFKQVFEVAKYLVEEKYQKGLVHVPYGLVRLKTGRMSSREGTVIYIKDLINDAINKSKEILINKNKEVEDIEILSKQIGVGALVFNYLKSNKLKDILFDLDETLRFDGETGPYIQYTYVRTKSILEKSGYVVSDFENIKLDLLTNSEEIELVKKLGEFENIIKRAAQDFEPSIIAKYLIDISSLFSKFYNNIKVLETNNEDLKKARVALVYSTGIVIKNGLNILGIDTPSKM